MPVERVVNPVCRRVWLIISNTKLSARAQQLQEWLRQPLVIPRQYADVPGPLLFPIHRREAVNGDDLQRRIVRNTAFDDPIQHAMVRLINRSNASRAILLRDCVVSRDGRVFAARYHRTVMSGITIHIEDETGHCGVHQWRVQQVRQSTRKLQSAGIPSDVALQLSGWQAQPFQ
jgi:hypothetical protein